MGADLHPARTINVAQPRLLAYAGFELLCGRSERPKGGPPFA